MAKLGTGSIKEQIVTRSSIEAKCRASTEDVSELIWIYRLLEDLSLPIHEPVKLFSDSNAPKGLIRLISNACEENRMHVDIKY